MENNIAIIDMGTNTFHLMIATLRDGTYQIVHRERVPVKIGMGGINDGRITDEGAARALKAIQNFKSTLQKYSVTKTMAFGTSALRNAKNGKAVVEKIKAETDIETKIISGDAEATYIFEGIRSAMKLGSEKSLIVDIGGGSVEFIIGNENQLFWKQSFEIGAQRLLEKYQKHDPILPKEVETLNRYFASALQPLSNAIAKHQPRTLVGSSGTFDTLSEIHCLRQNIPWQELPETALTLKSFYEIFEEFKVKSRAQRLQIPGMIEMRVDMIVVACCLIHFLITHFTFTNVRVSSHSLKEGVLATLSNGA